MKRTMRLAKRIGIVAIGFALAASGGAIAADVVAVVSSRSSVTALTNNQVADIFLGKTNRYPDGRPAVPIDQAEGIAARDAFYAMITGKSAAQMKAHWSKIIFTGRGQPPKQVANSVEAKKMIVGDLKAIGYIDRGLVDDSLRVVLPP